jgi:plasmid stabilization system protein ParE
MILLSAAAVLDADRLRAFLEDKNPGAAQRALATIWTALERVEHSPRLGMATDDPGIRQLVIRHAGSAYIARHAILPDGKGILVTCIWHGREDRA